MATTYDDGTLWLVVAVIAAGTFLIRVSFILLFGRLDEVPPRVEWALQFVPAAVLTALVVPAFVSLNTSLSSAVDPAQLSAGFVGVIVAWRTGSVIWTLVAGMGVLWAVSFLI